MSCEKHLAETLLGHLTSYLSFSTKTWHRKNSQDFLTFLGLVYVYQLSCRYSFLPQKKTQRKLTDESDLAWVVVQNTTIKTRSISREGGGGEAPSYVIKAGCAPES